MLEGVRRVRVVHEDEERLPGIDALYLFGSWAARYSGVEGQAPGDVDVLVVGHPDRDDVYDAAKNPNQNDR